MSNVGGRPFGVVTQEVFLCSSPFLMVVICGRWLVQKWR